MGAAETGEKFEWKNWLTDLAKAGEEIKNRKRGVTSETKRYLEIKNGVITSSVGVGVMIFLYIFMQGLISSGNIPPNGVAILSRVWIAGIIPFFVGLGLIFNGVVVSKRELEAFRGEPVTKPVAVQGYKEPHALRAADTGEIIPSDASVTEQTTRQLREIDEKQ